MVYKLFGKSRFHQSAFLSPFHPSCIHKIRHLLTFFFFYYMSPGFYHIKSCQIILMCIHGNNCWWRHFRWNSVKKVLNWKCGWSMWKAINTCAPWGPCLGSLVRIVKLVILMLEACNTSLVWRTLQNFLLLKSIALECVLLTVCGVHVV